MFYSLNNNLCKGSTLLATATTSGTTITISNSDSIQNYRFIYVEAYVSSAAYLTILLPVITIVTNKGYEVIGYVSGTTNFNGEVNFVSNTTAKFTWTIAGWTLTSFKIYGIK